MHKRLRRRFGVVGQSINVVPGRLGDAIAQQRRHTETEADSDDADSKGGQEHGWRKEVKNCERDGCKKERQIFHGFSLSENMPTTGMFSIYVLTFVLSTTEQLMILVRINT